MHVRAELFIALCFSTTLADTAAIADVTISTSATQSMDCSNGICSPTAKDAVLNVSDLQSMLASGSVEVTTTGTGIQAGNLGVDTPFGWPSQSTLALDAFKSISVNQAVTISGQGGMAFTTNDGGSGGTLNLSRRGHISFDDLSSQLTINGISYVLEGSIASLATDISSNPYGSYALAHDYDADPDGTYDQSPVSADFYGIFEGLGNRIENLQVVDSVADYTGGLFYYLEPDGLIENVGLLNLHVTGGEGIGGLVMSNWGTLRHDFVNGIVESGFSTLYLGGLTASSLGEIDSCYTTGKIEASQAVGAGLVAENHGSISRSYSTMTVTGDTDIHSESAIAGFVELNDGNITDSYAEGAVSGRRATERKGGEIGGFVGDTDYGSISDSYSTGKITGHGSAVGGFAGTVLLPNETTNAYWDVTTSKTTDGAGGGNSEGITGLTTKQLRSGLPSGFDPSTWGEKKGINGGLPYLLANPASK